ncbi:MAG: hypothetical protein AB8G15_01580 [Saprospiraceae bacterium]
MKKRVQLLLLTLLVTSTIIAQIKPVFVPEDVQSNDIQEGCYCKPGVRYRSPSKGIRLNYGLISEGRFREDNTLFSPFSNYNSFQHLEFDIKIPIIIKDDFKLLLGYKYFTEFFSFDQFGLDYTEVFQHLGKVSLKSNSYSLIISKPINATQYMALRFRYSANGDYEGWTAFENKYSIYKVLGIYAFKPNEDLEWAIGLNISKSFRRTNFLPFLVYNKNFSKRWGMEAIFPGYIYGRYNIGEEDILLFGAQYGSRSYRIDLEGADRKSLAYAYNHSELLVSTVFEHQFIPWVWGNLKLGYQINFSSDFESRSDSAASFNAEPTNGIYFQVGLFVSPPRD